MRYIAFPFFLGVLLNVGYASVASAQQVPKPAKVRAERPLPGDGDDSDPSQPTAPNQLFVGEWEWRSGNDVFHLSLTRDPAYVFADAPSLPPRDVIIGHFVYTRNGVVVDQSLHTGRRPYAAFGGAVDMRRMEAQFHDHGANRSGYLTLSFPPNNHNTLTWTLIPRETWHSPGPFIVPLSLTLTRLP